MNGTVPFGLSASAQSSYRNANPSCCSTGTPHSAHTQSTLQTREGGWP